MAIDLKKKIGPLPAWGWGAVGLAGGGLFLWWRHQQAAAAGTAATNAANTTTTGSSPNPYTGGDGSWPDYVPPGTGAYTGPPTTPSGPDAHTLHELTLHREHLAHLHALHVAHLRTLAKERSTATHPSVVKTRVVADVPRLSSSQTTANSTYIPTAAHPITQTVAAARPAKRA